MLLFTKKKAKKRESQLKQSSNSQGKACRLNKKRKNAGEEPREEQGRSGGEGGGKVILTQIKEKVQPRGLLKRTNSNIGRSERIGTYTSTRLASSFSGSLNGKERKGEIFCFVCAVPLKHRKLFSELMFLNEGFCTATTTPRSFACL